MDDHFHALMNTYDYESALFRIDPKLRAYRELKEKYITFNSRNAGNPSEARKEMQTLIQEYQKSEYILVLINNILILVHALSFLLQ